MTVFALVWFEQLISLTGSGLTEFVLGVWVFQRTGSPVTEKLETGSSRFVLYLYSRKENNPEQEQSGTGAL